MKRYQGLFIKGELYIMPKENKPSYTKDSAVDKLVFDAKLQDADAYVLAYSRAAYINTLSSITENAEAMAYSIDYDTPMEMSELKKLDSQLVTLWQTSKKAAEITGKIGGDKISFSPELKELIGNRFKAGEVLEPDERRGLVNESKGVLDNFISYKGADAKIPTSDEEMLKLVLAYPDRIKRSDMYDAVVFGVDMKLLKASNDLEKVKLDRDNFEKRLTNTRNKEIDAFSRDLKLQGFAHNEEEMKKFLSGVCSAMDKSTDEQKQINGKMLLAYAYSKYVSEGAKNNPDKIKHEQIFNPYFVEEASKFISVVRNIDIEFKPEKKALSENEASAKINNVALYSHRNKVRGHRDEILDDGYRGLVNRDDDELKKATPDNQVKQELIKRAQSSSRN